MPVTSNVTTLADTSLARTPWALSRLFISPAFACGRAPNSKRVSFRVHGVDRTHPDKNTGGRRSATTAESWMNFMAKRVSEGSPRSLQRGDEEERLPPRAA